MKERHVHVGLVLQTRKIQKGERTLGAEFQEA